VRTFAEWDQGRPGFVEIDLVGHEGGDARGELAYSLCVTDVAAAGPRCASCVTAPAGGPSRRCSTCAPRCPSRCSASTCDNGGELVNAHLVSWCSEQRLTWEAPSLTCFAMVADDSISESHQTWPLALARLFARGKSVLEENGRSRAGRDG